MTKERIIEICHEIAEDLENGNIFINTDNQNLIEFRNSKYTHLSHIVMYVMDKLLEDEKSM